MRTVTLELLRHGPAHNQLLSPLTPYLALCENHAPVTINVPFEHNQFLHRLATLTYELGTHREADNQRQFQLFDTGRELSRILSAIPGLTAELNRHRESPNEIIHLRLVLSASELALLPFELVLAGNGFPGFGQPLLLQNQAPICLTREVRRVQDPSPKWRSHPGGSGTAPWARDARVLLVCASPAGLPRVPVEAHALALRAAFDPWIGYFSADDDEARRREVDRRLHVIPAATIDAIQEACARESFSHVHVLAHGFAQRDGFDLRFGIALHGADPEGAADIVRGDRLASALRPMRQPGRHGFARPMVVTLASCNGANAGSVVGVGASVAHALQEAGIPLVVAGQFPLTFGGSVELVKTLYEGLLWGADPRSLLMDLRRRMHVLQPQSHDWASLTAYASLPVDFDQQMEELVIDRARRALKVAMQHADHVLLAATRADGPRDHDAMERVRERIAVPLHRMLDLVRRLPRRSFELHGLLASLFKRIAEVELASTQVFVVKQEDFASRNGVCLGYLGRAKQHYRECFQERLDASWAIVQYIGLALLTELPQPGGDLDFVELVPGRASQLRDLWNLAYRMSMQEVQESSERGGWALGNLIELQLLAQLLDIGESAASGALSETTEMEAMDWVSELVRRAKSFPFQMRTTRRQLECYANWFGYVNRKFERVRELAEQLLELMPEERLDESGADGELA